MSQNLITEFIQTIGNSIAAFLNNTAMFSGIFVLEGVICAVVIYTVYTCGKTFFTINEKEMSQLIDKVLMSGGVFYILRFLDAYLISRLMWYS